MLFIYQKASEISVGIHFRFGPLPRWYIWDHQFLWRCSTLNGRAEMLVIKVRSFRLAWTWFNRKMPPQAKMSFHLYNSRSLCKSSWQAFQRAVRETGSVVTQAGHRLQPESCTPLRDEGRFTCSKMVTLNLDDRLLAAYIFYGSILMLKMWAMSFLTARHRIKNKVPCNLSKLCDFNSSFGWHDLGRMNFKSQ